MGRTRTQVRQEVARQTGLPFISGTSTASSATTITDLPVLGRFGDDTLVGAFIYLVDATAKDRQITDNVQSTGVVTVIPSSSAGMDGTDAYEILPFPADAIHDAIIEALLMLYDAGALVRPLRLTGVAGSPVYNGFPEYWTSSSALDGWNVSGLTLARSQVGSDKWVTEEAAALSTATGTLTLAEPWRRFLTDLAPGTVSLYAWVRSATANSIRLGWVDGTGTVTYTVAHNGDASWQLIYLENSTLNSTDIDWTVRLFYDSAATTNQFGGLWVLGSNYPAYHPLPLALMPDGPDAIYSSPMGIDTTNRRALPVPVSQRSESFDRWQRYHDAAQDVEQGLVVWGKSRPQAGRLLHFVGSGPHTLPTTDAGVIEVNRMEAVLVAKVAALILLERNPGAGGVQRSERMRALSADIKEATEGHGESASSAPLGARW